MIQGATQSENANVFIVLQISCNNPMSVKIVGISCFEIYIYNKFSFIQDQFTRMVSDIFFFCNSFRSYFDNFREETSDTAK